MLQNTSMQGAGRAPTFSTYSWEQLRDTAESIIANPLLLGLFLAMLINYIFFTRIENVKSLYYWFSATIVAATLYWYTKEISHDINTYNSSQMQLVTEWLRTQGNDYLQSYIATPDLHEVAIAIANAILKERALGAPSIEINMSIAQVLANATEAFGMVDFIFMASVTTVIKFVMDGNRWGIHLVMLLAIAASSAFSDTYRRHATTQIEAQKQELYEAFDNKDVNYLKMYATSNEVNEGSRKAAIEYLNKHHIGWTFND